MAESAALFLKIKGVDCKGESTVAGEGNERKDSIECLQIDYKVEVPREMATGIATGRRIHDYVRIVKRMDCATPSIFKALTENELVDGTIKLYRPDPTGSQAKHFMTIAFWDGNVSLFKQMLPNTLAASESNSTSPLEEVGFVFRDIEITYQSTGASHKDSWSGDTKK